MVIIEWTVQQGCGMAVLVLLRNLFWVFEQDSKSSSSGAWM